MSGDMIKIIIGLDDTDSRDGMCTTYLGALIADELSSSCEQAGDLLLVRLNPTIPYKTRGNASVAISVECHDPTRVIGHVISRIASFARMDCENTNPGVVFVLGDDFDGVKPELDEFFRRAVRDVITIDEAKAVAGKLGLTYRAFKNGRGLIGALAACGAMLNPGWDHTYEYLTYRKKEMWGTPRFVDSESLYEADNCTYPETWDSVDRVNKIVVCVPRSPDPVLFGIRGNSRQAVTEAVGIVRSEEIERSCIYRTNQGTDMHLIHAAGVDDVHGMHSYILEGIVETVAHTIKGGHSIFVLSDDWGKTIDCAAFEPTKNFRDVVRRLIPGDRVIVYGSVMDGTFNIEKINILSLAEVSEKRNPECPSCGKRMKSAGAEQGYRCRKCGTTAQVPETVCLERTIAVGFYEVPSCARRHLAKPLIRFKTPDTPLFPGR
ncbi:tRNA(Ile)(2)-agmatinylcytidine synthase [Methanolobus halotolerans]|uniref:tRNA(Ile2) 2-agmatinylcytidine synthetase TiaS n=1 Tax=Methanolobus halotolerans TaxID=2052935 RepID=A0A4E0QQB2_9EURY|nr:tRNA(Ile)(2)-agmatinylcytidine synthase [Methanolobus halotolerans]TGC07394.1 tRNA(Ile2) 2-agmatinylcytidine synthetase [Methanolobus halotolerans]